MFTNKYNSSWEGYLGDVLNGAVGVNQLKPRHAFFDALGLEKALGDNTYYHVVLTPNEARSITDDINCRLLSRKRETSRDYLFSRNTKEQSANISLAECFSRGINLEKTIASTFNVADKLSVYAGNINDTRGLYDIIREFRSLGVTAKIFTGDNGKQFIHISGHAGLRRIITGTRYGASHPKMLTLGIGQQGLKTSIVKGMKFCIFFSVGYRLIECIFKDQYTLAHFLGNITVDMAKIAIGAVVTFATNAVITGLGIAAGSIIGVAIIIVAVGFLTVWTLDYLDSRYGFSAKLIALIKHEMTRVERTPEANAHYILNGLSR